MTNMKELLIQLKKVREEKGLSYTDISRLMEENGDYPLSKATLSRVFSEGSEELSFRYEETLRPIANALLDIENYEDEDNSDVKSMKALLRYKAERIEELEHQIEHLQSALDKEKLKSHEKLEAERDRFKQSIEFLKDQLAYKDKRMDEFMKSVMDKDKQLAGMLDHIMNCPYRKKETS